MENHVAWSITMCKFPLADLRSYSIIGMQIRWLDTFLISWTCPCNVNRVIPNVSAASCTDNLGSDSNSDFEISLSNSTGCPLRILSVHVTRITQKFFWICVSIYWFCLSKMKQRTVHACVQRVRTYVFFRWLLFCHFIFGNGINFSFLFEMKKKISRLKFHTLFQTFIEIFLFYFSINRMK